MMLSLKLSKVRTISLFLACWISISAAFSTGHGPRIHRQGLMPTILVHGGAGDIDEDMVIRKFNGTKAAVRQGYQVLMDGGSVMDAVMETIKVLEDNPAFNAGKGAALTQPGHIETDASIMRGSDLAAGSVASVSGIRNPIVAARKVLEQTPHVQLAGDSASNWAVDQGCETEDEDYFITLHQYEYWLQWLEDHNMTKSTSGEYKTMNQIETMDKWKNQKSTVGAVAIDADGNIAAGTSTGGLTGKLPGRVGDTPGVGHGVFADNDSVGVSGTGVGESFMKVGVARRVSYLVEKTGLSPNDAITETLDYMAQRVGGDGGVIAIDGAGNLGIGWNSNQMSWAYGRDGELHYGVNRGEDFVEDI